MTTSRHSRPTSPRPSSRPFPPYALWLQADEAATTDKLGGRVERRWLQATTMLAGYLDWPGLAQVGRLERTVTVGGEVTVEVQYLISSVPRQQADAATLLRWTRGH